MASRWSKLLLWSTPKETPELEEHRARVIAVVIWMAVVLSAASALQAWLSSIWLLAALNGFDLVVSAVLLQRYRTRSWEHAPGTVRALLLAHVIPLALGTLSTTPMEPTNLAYLILLPLASAVIFTPRETRRWFVAMIVVGALVIVAGHRGFVMPQRDPAPTLTQVTNFAAALAAAMALMQAMATERERSVERFRQAERAKSAFFANVGHEIRTPLNGVVGMADALLNHPLDAETQEMVGVIRTSATMLHALIDDLLDLSKLEAGRLDLHLAPVALAQLLDETRALWAPLAERKGLALSVARSADTPAAARLDALRVRQILNNLISNAVKFTDAGRVDVRVEPREGWLVITVRDTGIGIAPEQQAHLFERFVQVDDARARRQPGTGLGLWLSRQLSELMGGSLTLESAPDAGSTFTCTLPLEEAPMPESAPVAPRSLRPGLKVLIVDDNPVNRLVVQRLLKAIGCVAATATDGPSAIEACEGDAFDVVLMDVHMPVMDGLEVTRRLRARRGREYIIGLSASADRGDVEACREAGMDDFVAKPVTAARLSAALRRG